MSVLENGPSRDRGLVPAERALQETGPTGFPGSLPLAFRTAESIGPAESSQVFAAAGLGGEAVSELGEGARIVLDRDSGYFEFKPESSAWSVGLKWLQFALSLLQLAQLRLPLLAISL